MSTSHRILRRMGWTCWTLVLAVMVGFGVSGIIGPVVQTTDFPVCSGTAIGVTFDGSGASRECHGDAVAQVWLSTIFTVAVALAFGGRVRVVLALRRHRRRVGAGGAPPAMANEATLRAYRRTLTRLLLLLVGASVFFAGFLWTLDGSTRRSDDLAQRGLRSDGQVTRVRSGGKSRPWVEYDYRFDGVGHSGSVDTDGSSPDYEVGQAVVVLVHPDDPSRSTIVGEEEDPTGGAMVLLVVTLVGGSILITLAAPRAMGWWRMSALLTGQAWREVTVHQRQWVGFREARTIALVEDDGSSEVVGLAPYLEPSLYEVSRGTVWAVGAPGVGYVLAPEGGGRLVWATRSALPLRRVRWRRAIGPTGPDRMA